MSVPKPHVAPRYHDSKRKRKRQRNSRTRRLTPPARQETELARHTIRGSPWQPTSLRRSIWPLRLRSDDASLPGNAPAEFARLPAAGLKREDVLGDDAGPRGARGGPLGKRSCVGLGLSTAIARTSTSSTASTPLHSQANQLHSDLWPSAAKFEAEIVAMTAHMLRRRPASAPFGTQRGFAARSVRAVPKAFCWR